MASRFTQHIDKDIVRVLKEGADSMLNDLWNEVGRNRRRFEENIGQITNWSADRIEVELEYMPRLKPLLQKRDGINVYEFMPTWLKNLASDNFVRTAKYVRETSTLACERNISDIYERTLEDMGFINAGTDEDERSRMTVAADTKSKRTWVTTKRLRRVRRGARERESVAQSHSSAPSASRMEGGERRSSRRDPDSQDSPSDDDDDETDFDSWASDNGDWSRDDGDDDNGKERPAEKSGDFGADVGRSGSSFSDSGTFSNSGDYSDSDSGDSDDYSDDSYSDKDGDERDERDERDEGYDAFAEQPPSATKKKAPPLTVNLESGVQERGSLKPGAPASHISRVSKTSRTSRTSRATRATRATTTNVKDTSDGDSDSESLGHKHGSEEDVPKQLPVAKQSKSTGRSRQTPSTVLLPSDSVSNVVGTTRDNNDDATAAPKPDSKTDPTDAKPKLRHHHSPPRTMTSKNPQSAKSYNPTLSVVSRNRFRADKREAFARTRQRNKRPVPKELSDSSGIEDSDSSDAE